MNGYKSEKGVGDATVTRRNTRAKTLILKCLKSLGGKHITAEELSEMLKSENTPVAKSTLYRFLAQLEQDGLVKKYFSGENASCCYRFVGEGSECNEHFHLLCRQCGEITHFENPMLEQMMKKLDGATDFSIDIHDSQFYGTCKTCMRKAKSEK
ncbi:MAG: transcriptional repressor [Clostridia bacterium]|nr:transcriptional repressor [Clostridia bacterium]